MKIIYELDSENPDHRTDIEVMHNARNYYKALWEIDQLVRSWQKYGGDRKHETVEKLLSEIRSMISETGAIEV